MKPSRHDASPLSSHSTTKRIHKQYISLSNDTKTINIYMRDHVQTLETFTIKCKPHNLKRK